MRIPRSALVVTTGLLLLPAAVLGASPSPAVTRGTIARARSFPGRRGAGPRRAGVDAGDLSGRGRRLGRAGVPRDPAS